MTTDSGSNHANAITAVPIIFGVVLQNADRAAPDPASQGLRRPKPGGYKCITPYAISDCPLSRTRLSESC